jgi:phosphoglucosamine mutase
MTTSADTPSTPQQRQLFGTDGIRSVAGEFPLTRESVFLIGIALGRDLRKNSGSGQVVRVVTGQDTRESSSWIADRLALGLASQGVEVHSAGILTTPGVAYLARSRGYSAGIVISASHNPWMDNGIKVFSGDGYKFPDARELEVEQEIFALIQQKSPEPAVNPAPAPSLPGEEALRRKYIDWLAGGVSADLSKLKVLVDCANGAAAAEAPELFRKLRIPATILHASPTGKNINDGCGALHAAAVGRALIERKSELFDLGVTFDGDADRALFCDGEGRGVNGDAVLLLAARDMQARGKLANAAVVATTMSNMGLEIALKRSGIRMLRANVGDKYVLEEMQKTGATLGGEQSGHILFRDGDATTGDGLATALRVMEVIVRSGKPLAELVGDLKVFPQVIKNIRVRVKTPLAQVPSIAQAIQEAENSLNGNGRVVVRYSGTEALARVMVEAEDEATMTALADSIAGKIQAALGM